MSAIGGLQVAFITLEWNKNLDFFQQIIRIKSKQGTSFEVIV